MNVQCRHLLMLCALVMTAGCLTMPQAPPVVPGSPAAAAAVAAAGRPNLMQFLGLAPVCKHLKVKAMCVLALLGKAHPCLEPKPPLLPLSSPANLKSPIPAVAAAAKVKAAEDAAPQKIKALQYLATIGCTTCYPDVKPAFLAALHDCTEEVRFAAVSALLETSGNPCSVCKHSVCCGPDIMCALHDIAYKIDPQSGCYLEPSARVRRVARLAIRGCGNTVPLVESPGVPLEGPVPPPAVPTTPTPAPPLSQGPAADSGVAPRMVQTDTSQTSLSKMTVVQQEDNGTLAAPEDATLVRADYDPTRTEDANDLVLNQQESMAAESHVTEQQIQDYYETHPEQFSRPTEVRWEQITAAYNDFESEETAVAAMEYLELRTSGVQADRPSELDLAQVEVRTFGWTPRRDVPSPVIAQALFSLPVERTSAVLTDSTGCHLVRVLEQRAERVAPLSTVREEVVQRIIEQRTTGGKSRMSVFSVQGCTP